MAVVGAGQAGVQIVDSLRRGGYAGRLFLIGDERDLPYQRPPLSKGFLAGQVDEARLRLRPASFYEKLGVETRFGSRVAVIERQQKALILENGARIGYDKLAVAIGARVRPLMVAGAGLERVMYLRTVEDARRIRAALGGADDIVIVGGGFIGLEVAAVGRGLGKRVSVIEAEARLMPRAVAPLVAEFFQTAHRERGVRVITGAPVSGIEESSGRLSVRCADGRAYAGDVVIVGTGVVPNTELAERAGLACEDGVLVDEFARTSDPDIVAAGDCTMHANARLGVRHRLESVQNAVDQAAIAAATLLGENRPYAEIPWFWSDQYDLRLQMVGIAKGHDQQVVRGDIAAASFSVFYFKRRRLVAVDSVNRIADHMVCRRLLSAGVGLRPDQAADEHLDLKQLLRD